MRIWVMLPAYNEAESLPRLLPKIKAAFDGRAADYRIVVVDDGSRDGMAEILKKCQTEYPIDVVTHEINRGLGETERDGFEYIAKNGGDDDILVRLDCDDTHEPQYIFTMIEKLGEGYDVVNTSRFQPGGGQMGVNSYRSFISYCANAFMKLMFNIRGIKDYSCGYRAYRLSAIKRALNIFGNRFLRLKDLGFTSTLETIVKLNLMGCRFAEVPFVLRYDQKTSVSKMVSSVTTLGYFLMALMYHWPLRGWKAVYKKSASVRVKC